MLGAARHPTTQSTTINAYGSSGLPRSASKRRPDHSGSKLLTAAENQLMFEILGQNKISLSAAVVQLLEASGGKWKHLHVGVVSLVKDYDRKVYTLILFDIYNGNKLWEQVLYKNFNAKTYPKCRKLLSFEGERCILGLNFSDEHEAADLKIHLDKRREAETGQRDSTMRVTATNNQTISYLPPQQHKVQSPGFTNVGSTSHVATHQIPATALSKKKSKTEKKGKTKIRKEDIGFPTNFEHKAHLGWDTEGGFSQHVKSSEGLDESVIELLKVAGQNPEIMTREDLNFAHEFVSKYQRTEPAPPMPAQSYPTMQRNGQSAPQYQKGFTMAPMSGQHQQPKYQTSTPAQSHYSYQTAQQHPYNTMSHHVDSTPMPPPAPARDSSMYSGRQQQTPARPPPIERPPPPQFEKPQPVYSYQPPTQINNVPPAPPMSQPNASRPGPRPPPPPALISKPVKIPNAPPAPPPVATMSSNAPVAPPPMPQTASNGSSDDGRAGLLAQIQAGKKLKHVAEPVEKSGFATGKAAPANERDQMLGQIREGKQLKHVDNAEQENRKSVPNVSEIGGIAGALARALEERRKNVGISDDSDNSDDNDSEWEDN